MYSGVWLDRPDTAHRLVAYHLPLETMVHVALYDVASSVCEALFGGVRLEPLNFLGIVVGAAGSVRYAWLKLR